MGTAAALPMTSSKPSVLIPLKSAESFLDYYTERGVGTLFVPGYVDIPSGTQVVIEVAFSDPALTFSSKGVVRWKRSKASRNLAAGIGVEFLPEEAGTRDLLVKFAKGESIPQLQQRARRFPAQLDLELLMGGAKMRARTQNISHTGAFIASSRLAEVHSVLPVTLSGPEPISIDAEVMWVRQGDSPGMGVQFLIDERATALHVRKLVELVRQDLAARRKG